MKLLFIAYYFEPYPGVGSQRISYWAKHLNEVAPDIKVDVITATKGCIQIPNGKVIYIEKKGTGLWTKFFKTDPGASWGYDIKKWLKANGSKYDIILFTGGPFLHFRLAAWIKRNTSAKVIFDFRDPMSVNPRSNFNSLSLILKNQVMRYLERVFVRHADVIVSVNEWCLNLVIGTESKKRYIIDNGYDETILNEITNCDYRDNFSSKIRFVYAGNFYVDRNPTNFLRVINSDENLKKSIEFIHIGKKSNWLQPFEKECWLNQYGEKSYSETLKILNTCDYGLVFTFGYQFESTTKIFDYIGMGLKVLIITNKIPESGALLDYTKIYPKIMWIENDLSKIDVYLKNDISKNTKDGKDNENTKLFSRYTGLKKLAKLINQMIE